jgi:hypothetical protein
MKVFDAQARKMPHGEELLKVQERKLICAHNPTNLQPTYADFFRYANKTFLGKVVLFSNADVVFDESLGDFDREPIKRHEYGYVLSVVPPPKAGEYTKVFKQECDNTPRCAVGAWMGGGPWGQGPDAGNSWDSYIFSPPLASTMDLDHIAIKMNLMGSQNLAGFQLESNGHLTLYNPCYHIRSYHWHCIADQLPDPNPYTRADRPPWWTQMFGQPPHSPWDAVDTIFPCWNCPGVLLPTGAVATSQYCQKGTLVTVNEVPALRQAFRYPWVNVGICCKEYEGCGNLPVQRLPHCSKATDVDCLTWEFNNKHHYY